MTDLLITVIVATTGLYVFYRLLTQKKIVKNVDNKVVLITGASSGLGEGNKYKCNCQLLRSYISNNAVLIP
jgi:hypothetical protein